MRFEAGSSESRQEELQRELSWIFRVVEATRTLDPRGCVPYLDPNIYASWPVSDIIPTCREWLRVCRSAGSVRATRMEDPDPTARAMRPISQQNYVINLNAWGGGCIETRPVRIADNNYSSLPPQTNFGGACRMWVKSALSIQSGTKLCAPEGQRSPHSLLQTLQF
jgi:hypothetical protein